MCAMLASFRPLGACKPQISLCNAEFPGCRALRLQLFWLQPCRGQNRSLLLVVQSVLCFVVHDGVLAVFEYGFGGLVG